MNIRKSINYFAGKLLYLWIRTAVLPIDVKQLNIRNNLPLIYVMDARSWTNLLVLETECKRQNLPMPLEPIPIPELAFWHGVYSISPREPFKAWLQRQPKRSRMLRGIVQVLQDNPELEVQFVPVSIFWGRPVAVQKNWIRILFADSWKVAGRFRKFFLVLFHGRNTFVQFSEIITYKECRLAGESNDEIIDKLQAVLTRRLVDVRTATLGPDMSHRRTLVHDLILNDEVQKAISKRQAEENISEENATLQARRYLNEIVANSTSITIQVMQRLLSYFWNRFYSGIQVNNSKGLSKLAQTHELVYVPCHRSHIDYLLLSYVIYFQGLAIPYIAAGKNLNMPIIGSILRGGGAFFIRRSFKGNELYSTLMFEYLAKLISKGVAIEYFIEGGRSRTGRLLKPKPGMLAMTVRGYLKYRKRPIAFVPVYIGYEKLLESKAYQAELSGEGKKSENLLGSIRAILKIRGNYGRVYTNFGQPVFLNKILDYEHPSWVSDEYTDSTRPVWVRKVVSKTSNIVMTRINQAVNVNSINLISIVMLATKKQSIDEKELVNMLDKYSGIILSLDYSDNLTITKKSANEQIAHAESLKMLERRNHELGDILYLDEKHRVALTYYRNNILHLIAIPSIIACCFFNRNNLTRQDIVSLVTLSYPFLRTELFLVWTMEELDTVISRQLRLLVEQDLLIRNEASDSYSRRGSGTIQFSQLNLLAKAISPILEVYYLTLAILSLSGNKSIPKSELQNRCQLMAQRVAMIYELNSPDYSDKHLISNFIDALINIDYIKVYGTEENLRYSEVFERADKRIRLLLSKEMRTNILQLIKQSESQ